MDENNGKFKLGDNTDGYRRSTPDYDLDLFADHKKKPQEPAAQGTSHRSGGARQPNSRRPAKKPDFFSGRSSQPVPEKSGPSVKRHGKPPQVKQRRPAGQQERRRPVPETPAQERSLSQNERNAMHSRQRKAQRRQKQILQYIGIGLVVAAVMVVLSLTVFFKIDEIVIDGDKSPYSDEQIIAASGISFDENIITCNADGVSGKLAKALPYIGSAQVKRSLSGKVTITLKLTPGCYSFFYGDTAVIADKSGKVLEIAAIEAAVNHTVVQGAQIATAVPGDTVELTDKGALDLLKSLTAQFEAVGITAVTSIDITDIHDISAVYDGRLTLELGDTGMLERKLALGAKVIERENEIDPMQYGSIDLGSVEGKAFFRPLEAPEEEETSEEDVSQDGQPESDGAETPEEDTTGATTGEN